MFKDCEDCPWMVSVPTASKCSELSIGHYEVTWEEYGHCVDTSICTMEGGSMISDDDDVAFGLSFKSALSYTEYLSSKTGKSYSLPYLNEWAKASGLDDDMNFDDNLKRVLEESHTSTHPIIGRVKGSELNALAGVLQHGLGNVSEWSLSCQQDTCEKRALLGGNWSMSPEEIQKQPFVYVDPTRDSILFGLRVVRRSECPS